VSNPEAISVLLGTVLVVGFAIGYGLREFISRRRHRRYRNTVL
jgi:uncharacterized membrane protein (Fun14 family)